MTIGTYAFSGCKNVEQLNLTNRIVTISDYAFQNLKKITSIKVYNSTELIGVGAFKGCNNLEEITLPFVGRNDEALYYNAVFGYIFGYEQKDTYPGYSLDNVFVNTNYYETPQGMTWQYSSRRQSFGNSSFYYYIPSSLCRVIVTDQTEVKMAAFNGCAMLTEITFTKGIESQGEFAFQNCTATVYSGTEVIEP